MVSQGCSWPLPTPCPLGPLPAPRPPSPLPSTLQRGGSLTLRPEELLTPLGYWGSISFLCGEGLGMNSTGPESGESRGRLGRDREGVQASEGPLWSFLPLGVAALPRWRCGVVDPLLLVRPTPLARCLGAGRTPRQLARCRVFCVARGGVGWGGPVHRAEGVAEQGLHHRAWVTGCRPFQHVTFL